MEPKLELFREERGILGSLLGSITEDESVRPRKIVQIVGVSDDRTGALCSDGTAWEFVWPLGSWRRLPPIPQDSQPVAKIGGTAIGKTDPNLVRTALGSLTEDESTPQDN
jgi:hypothetical protein